MLCDTFDNDHKIDVLAIIEDLEEIVGKTHSIGVYLRDIKKVQHPSSRYNTLHHKLRRWRKQQNDYIERAQYPGSGKIKTNHNVDGKSILS